MSIFASQTTSDPIPIPFDPPHTVTVRKLTGRELERAQQAHMIGIVSGSARTWAARFSAMAKTGDPKAMELLNDPLLGYDREAVIRSGLVAWSYSQPIAAVPPSEKTPDAIADLDDEAMDFIAREIMRRTKPSLFQTDAEREEARKNG